jgi:hypothetical protein
MASLNTILENTKKDKKAALKYDRSFDNLKRLHRLNYPGQPVNKTKNQLISDIDKAIKTQYNKRISYIKDQISTFEETIKQQAKRQYQRMLNSLLQANLETSNYQVAMDVLRERFPDSRTGFKNLRKRLTIKGIPIPTGHKNQYEAMLDALYMREEELRAESYQVYSHNIELLKEGYTLIDVQHAFDITNPNHTIPSGWIELQDIINESAPANIQIIVYDNQGRAYMGSPIYIQSKEDNFRVLFKKVIDNLFNTYRGIAHNDQEISMSTLKITKMLCYITPIGRNKDINVYWVADSLKTNCVIKMLNQDGYDTQEFLSKYKIYDHTSQAYSDHVLQSLKEYCELNKLDNTYSIDDIIPQINVPMSCVSLKVLAKMLNLRIRIYTGLRKHMSTHPIMVYNNHNQKTYDIIVENGHCYKIKDKYKISGKHIVDDFYHIPNDAHYIDYQDDGKVNYYLIEDPLKPLSFIIHKTYDESKYYLSDNMIVNDAKSLFKLIKQDYHLTKPHEVISKVLRSSELFIGCNVRQLDSSKQYYKYDLNSCYSSYHTREYYQGFPNGVLYTTPLVSSKTAFVVIKSIISQDDYIIDTLRWLGITISAGLCLTIVDYNKLTNLGIDLELDYCIDTNEWVNIDIRDKMREYNMPINKQTINSAIGWFLCGGVDNHIHKNIKYFNESEVKCLIRDCENNNIQYKVNKDMVSVDIPVDTYHSEALLNIHSYFLAYARWALIDGLLSEESHGNQCVGFKTDMLIFTNPQTTLTIDNKIGNWKLEDKQLSDVWYLKKEITYIQEDHSLHLLANNKLPMIHNPYRVIDGSAGMGKSREARNDKSASTALTCPSWKLVNDSSSESHPCSIARTNEGLFYLSRDYHFLKLNKTKFPYLIYIDESQTYTSDELQEMMNRAPSSMFYFIFGSNQSLGIKKHVDRSWFIQQGMTIKDIVRDPSSIARHTYEDGLYLDQLRGQSYNNIVSNILSNPVISIVDSYDFSQHDNHTKEEDFPIFISGNWDTIKKFNAKFNSKQIPYIDINHSIQNKHKVKRQGMTSQDDPSIWWHKKGMEKSYYQDDELITSNKAPSQKTKLVNIGCTVDALLGSSCKRKLIIDYNSLSRGDALYIALTRCDTLSNIYLIDL